MKYTVETNYGAMIQRRSVKPGSGMQAKSRCHKPTFIFAITEVAP
jgi:hypothetical protein